MIAELKVTDPDTGRLVTVKPAKASACADCPWRISNWGRTDTDHPEFNTAQRRSEMWNDHPERPNGTGVRYGAAMICHQGAPPGVGGTKAGSVIAYECSGSVALK